MSDLIQEITLPVSIGEALDKLSIFCIKMDRIKDNKREEIKKEFDILSARLKRI
jgi:hypothetical protein